MKKKVMEISCYVAGAGAFGVFLRWLQDQLAFNEFGLPDSSTLHVIVPVYVLICAALFAHFIKGYGKAGYVVPESFAEAFRNEGKLYAALRWVIGGLMVVGGLVLLMTSELDKYAGMLRMLSIAAMLAGVSFTVMTGLANGEDARPVLLCVCAFLPIVLYAIWLVYIYRANAINSVVLAYAADVATVTVAMAAFFRVAGFPFCAPKPGRCLFDLMLGGMLCLLSLADERYMGMHIILFSTAAMFLFYNWVLICNMRKVEKPVEVKPEIADDGFEHLQ